MRYAFGLEELREELVLLDRDRADEDRLAFVVELLDLAGDGFEFAGFGAEDLIVRVVADDRNIGRHGVDVEAVDLEEFFGGSGGGAGHAGEFRIHAEEILECDRWRKCAIPAGWTRLPWLR